MNSKRNLTLVLTAIATLIASASGCNSGPNFGPPGTVGAQRTRAIIHDPFPNNELGHEIEGGRPLGFERPRTTTTSLQTLSPRNTANQNIPTTIGF